MSQFWIYLKTNVRADFKQIHIILAMFLLLPLFFSLIMGFSYSTAFVPEVSIEPIQITVQNEDQGEAGELLETTLASEEITEYFEIVADEESDFNLLIHSDYSENFEETLITIETKENSSASEENMLVQFVTEWQQALVDQNALMAEIEMIQDPQIINNLQTSLAEVADRNMNTIFTAETHESSTALTSNQFTSVTGLMYILFMTLAGSAGMSTNKDFKGIRKRLGVVPLSPKKRVLFEMGANTVIYSFISIAYVVIWRLIDGNTFSGNPMFYLFWIIIYTLFFQAINSALMYIVPDKLSNIFYQGIFMLYMIFGFLPLDKMLGGEIGELFSRNFIREIFNQPFYDFMMTQQFTENLLIAGTLFIATVLIAALTIGLKQRRELSPA